MASVTLQQNCWFLLLIILIMFQVIFNTSLLKRKIWKLKYKISCQEFTYYLFWKIRWKLNYVEKKILKLKEFYPLSTQLNTCFDGYNRISQPFSYFFLVEGFLIRIVIGEKFATNLSQRCQRRRTGLNSVFILKLFDNLLQKDRISDIFSQHWNIIKNFYFYYDHKW